MLYFLQLFPALNGVSIVSLLLREFKYCIYPLQCIKHKQPVATPLASRTATLQDLFFYKH